MSLPGSSVERSGILTVPSPGQATVSPRDAAVRTAGKLSKAVVPIRDLTPACRDAMWDIFVRYYTGVTRARFERDLSGKDHAILLQDSAGSVRGFSTLQQHVRTVRGRRFIAIFSGDTVMERPFWGHGALQNAFGSYVTRAKLHHPRTPVYWFLVSKGYRTYLLLTRNFPDHWPRSDRPTPPWERAVIDELAQERFGEAWDAAAGVVRAHPTSGRLRDQVAPIEGHLLTLPEVRFFQESNPRWMHGDELGCLGKVGSTLWLRYLAKQARRALGRTFARPQSLPRSR